MLERLAGGGALLCDRAWVRGEPWRPDSGAGTSVFFVVFALMCFVVYSYFSLRLCVMCACFFCLESGSFCGRGEKSSPDPRTFR